MKLKTRAQRKLTKSEVGSLKRPMKLTPSGQADPGKDEEESLTLEMRRGRHRGPCGHRRAIKASSDCVCACEFDGPGGPVPLEKQPTSSHTERTTSSEQACVC